MSRASKLLRLCGAAALHSAALACAYMGGNALAHAATLEAHVVIFWPLAAVGLTAWGFASLFNTVFETTRRTL